MKKFLIIGAILFCVTGIVAVVIITTSENKIGTFTLSDYAPYLSNYKSDKVLQNSADKNAVVKNVEKIWIEMYGTDVKKEKPYHIDFDKASGTWHIYGNSSSNIFIKNTGGVAHILIRKSDGKVLAVWHEK